MPVRQFLVVVVISSSALWASLSTRSTALQQDNCPTGALKDQTYTCTLEDNRTISATVVVQKSDNGIMIEDLRVGGCLGGLCQVIKSMSVPFLEVELTEPGKAPTTHRLELKNPANTKLTKLICAEAKDDKGNPQPYGVQLDAIYQNLTVKGNMTLDVTESFRFYVRSKCRSPAPEFMPQLSYELKNVPKGAKVKLSIPYYFDFDLDDSLNDDVAVMVRESITELWHMTNVGNALLQIANLQLPHLVGCQHNSAPPKVEQPQGRAVIDCGNPNKQQHGQPIEFTNTDFDNYHQADELLTVPACTNAQAVLGIPIRWTPCVHIHQWLPHIQKALAASGIELHTTFVALRWFPQESDPKTIADIKQYVDKDALSDVVFWDIYEFTHQEGKAPMKGTAFLDSPFFPAYWGGFSCNSPWVFVLPSCD